MFRVTAGQIVIPTLEDDGSGAFVTFEGKVRDRNDGRSVLRLEYEAFAPMAEAEGERILDEATKAFGLTSAQVIHRTGLLEIGETAVWIGVSSPHRAEAFRACAHIIDELKKRVPIWKKEHYAEGDSDWIGVNEVDFGPAAELYRRQTILPHVGEAGQEGLNAAKVIVVGAGGLGCSALPYLAAAGVGTLGICEADTLDVSNLHRQILYGYGDRGLSKGGLAAKSISRLNPFIKVCIHDERLDRANAGRIIGDYDLVIDGTDNFATKFLLNEACVSAGVPLIQASIHQFEGQLLVVQPGSEGGCLRCLWPEAPFDGCVGTCEESGVLGSTPGAFGVLQANEALKLILGLPSPLDRHILLLDLISYETHLIGRAKRADCPVCGAGQAEGPIDIGPSEANGLAAIDIRERYEWDDIPQFPDAQRVPLSDLIGVAEAARAAGRCVLICAHGVRSAKAARWLRGQGVEAYSLIGGTEALR